MRYNNVHHCLSCAIDVTSHLNNYFRVRSKITLESIDFYHIHFNIWTSICDKDGINSCVSKRQILRNND